MKNEQREKDVYLDILNKIYYRLGWILAFLIILTLTTCEKFG